ncbi:hypothetical protein N5T77_10205 [Aliarcobacter cryaerophilus]|uniref:hypothetical protein n=1 Tax=Aliarcobacter cryaerophilus TaxID=28198 RepID=UPI0021B5470D|nr:hypothetical protein [Aliarcobacter cryaerophilus]MCT7525421.1 hypothetical protein [Aliarcobacter cryaerophilus]
MQTNINIHKNNIESSMKSIKFLYFLKAILLVLVVLSYIYKPEWFDILVIIILSTLILFPMNFYGAFIEFLLEYNTQTLEERIIKNANETNKYLNDNDKFKENIKLRIKNLEKELKILSKELNNNE